MGEPIWCSPLQRAFTPREFAQLRTDLAQYNRTFPDLLTPVAPGEIKRISLAMPSSGSTALRAWRSKTLIAVLWQQGEHHRLSICRTQLGDDGHYRDGLTWDDLQAAKAECGFDDRWVVEVYPPESEVVNVASMRHLFFLDAPPPFAWTAEVAAPPLLDRTRPQE